MKGYNELRKHLASVERPNAKQQRLLDAMFGDDNSDTATKQLISKAVERRAMRQQGVRKVAEIDWSSIDWAAIISVILKLLLLFI